MKKIAYILIFIMILSSTANASQKAEKLLLDYNIYASGFKALKASLEINLGDNDYEMELNAATQGFIGALFPWKASYKAEGKNKDGKLIPSSYKKTGTWRKGTKITEMKYGNKGEVLDKIVKEHNKTKKQKNIDKILSGNAADVLTGTLTMLQSVKNSEKCKGTFPVFDGKRRFNLMLKDEGVETLKKSKYSIFSGEAIKCTLIVEPVAGFKKKDKKRGWLAIQEHTKKRKKLPTLWLAKTKTSKQVIPVRMQIASSFGSVIAHLAKETLR